MFHVRNVQVPKTAGELALVEVIDEIAEEPEKLSPPYKEMSCDQLVAGCKSTLILAPLPIEFDVFLVHLATILITGTGINPARSLGAVIIYNKSYDSPKFLMSIYHVMIVDSLNVLENRIRLHLKRRKLEWKGPTGRKQIESEHVIWKDDIKVPCGKLVPSEHKDNPLKHNEYAVYHPQQVSIRFLVALKFEEKDVEYDTAEEKDWAKQNTHLQIYS